MEQSIFVGQAKVQKSGEKYFIYLPNKRLETSGGSKGFAVIYRIEVVGPSNSQPKGMFKKAKEGKSPLKAKVSEKIEDSKKIESAPWLVPQEEIDKLFILKSQGNPPEVIKHMFESESQYSWMDLPEQIIKELEKP